MSFLQQWMLAGLPLVALPVIIHLINQRRFQTIQWGAMMFLLAAHRMARGYSRLRQLLIMLFRMLAVAGLILAASRPLASGWLGLAAGSRADTTIILLDRSPSMQQRGAGAGESKLETGRKQLVRTFETLGSGHWVLIDSANHTPQELESPDALSTLPSAGPASSSADLPVMLQAAHDYIRSNRVGQTEVWICSDLRENDWTPESGRWATLRDAFLEFPQGVRIHLLAYPQPAPSNHSIRVTEVRRVQTDEGAEVLVSLRITRDGGGDEKTPLQIQFEIDGARSVMNVEVAGLYTDFKDHRLPVERSRARGWGRVSIPADANPDDDEFYFAFDNPPTRRTIIVADEPQSERPLQLVAGIAPDPSLTLTPEVVTVDQLPTVEWENVSLVLWQGSLPTGSIADQIQKFVQRGGEAVFLPPRNPGSEEFFGIRWTEWVSANDPVVIETWRGDEDLLGRTLSGAALPVGQLEIRKYCGLKGEHTPLATLRGGAPLVARVPTKQGGVYFWATTPAIQDSSLATNGVVLYAFVQRALEAGVATLGQARQLDAGVPGGENATQWTRLSEGDQGLSTEYPFHRGVYSSGEKLLAVNRPLAEDDTRILADTRVAELFRGLDFARVDDQAGSVNSLIQEIWRAFMTLMLIALILEAALCLPRIVRPNPVHPNPSGATT